MDREFRDVMFPAEGFASSGGMDGVWASIHQVVVVPLHRQPMTSLVMTAASTVYGATDVVVFAHYAEVDYGSNRRFKDEVYARHLRVLNAKGPKLHAAQRTYYCVLRHLHATAYNHTPLPSLPQATLSLQNGVWRRIIACCSAFHLHSRPAAVIATVTATAAARRAPT